MEASTLDGDTVLYERCTVEAHGVGYSKFAGNLPSGLLGEATLREVLRSEIFRLREGVGVGKLLRLKKSRHRCSAVKFPGERHALGGGGCCEADPRETRIDGQFCDVV